MGNDGEMKRLKADFYGSMYYDEDEPLHINCENKGHVNKMLNSYLDVEKEQNVYSPEDL